MRATRCWRRPPSASATSCARQTWPAGSGGDEFAIILPESTVDDGEGLYRRLGLAMAKRPAGQAGTLALSAGVAGLRAEDDAVSFFERADEALYRAKSAGKGTVAVAGPNEAPPPPPATLPRSAPGNAGK